MQVTLSDQTAFFTAFQFEECTWYHIGVSVQRKKQDKSTAVSLVVNGQLKQTEHCAAPAEKKRRSWPFLGCPPHHAEAEKYAEWQMGPFLLYETCLSVSMCQSLFHLGPNVRGCPLWNAPHFALREALLTNTTMMDRIGDNVESNLAR